ncbi:MAG: hypothetical protein ACP5N3_03775 [Candidatus Nanoarchaeia archaeon]
MINNEETINTLVICRSTSKTYETLRSSVPENHLLDYIPVPKVFNDWPGYLSKVFSLKSYNFIFVDAPSSQLIPLVRDAGFKGKVIGLMDVFLQEKVEGADIQLDTLKLNDKKYIDEKIAEALKK